jgi:hypothetical protein
MSHISTIYLDLDETLIHSIPGRPGMGASVHRKKITCGVKANGKPDTYHTELRGIAPDLVAWCQARKPTKLLTTAAREYALAHVKAFDLPFAPEDIIAFEDYLYEVSGPYGSKDLMVTAVNTDKNGVLIDNRSPETPPGRAKLLFLGIPKKHFLTVRDYEGGRDHEPAKVLEAITGWVEKVDQDQTLELDLAAKALKDAEEKTVHKGVRRPRPDAGLSIA